MHSVPQPEQGVYAVAMPGEDVLLLHQDSGKYYSLNQTASLIWKMMADASSNADMIHELVDRFDITAEDAEAALSEFQHELTSQKLISQQPISRKPI
jgi:hypothetical protein